MKFYNVFDPKGPQYDVGQLVRTHLKDAGTAETEATRALTDAVCAIATLMQPEHQQLLVSRLIGSAWTGIVYTMPENMVVQPWGKTSPRGARSRKK